MTTPSPRGPVRPSPRSIRPRAAAQTESGTVTTQNADRSVQIVEITPDLAREWLKANTHNRRGAANKRLEEFKADMIAGRWTFGLDAIGFDSNGVLLNGQTRLSCIVETGVTLPFIVATGLDPADQDNMDLVRRRSMADQLTLAGKSNASALAAVTASHWRWINLGNPFGRDREPTFAERRVWESEHDFTEAIKLARRINSALKVPPSTLGPIIHEAMRVDDEGIRWFVERLIDGQGLVEGDPPFALRRSYERNLTAARKAKQEYLAAWFIKAWNAWCLSRSIMTLIYRPVSNERFPDLIGMKP